MYTLLVCADLYGEKINLEITFPAMPTIGELQRKVVEVYSAEAQVKRPPGFPAIEFQVARLQVYDDVLLKWADLVTATQLHEYDQLYAFQPQSPWHIDVQKDLPPPRPPTSHASRAPPAAPHTPSTYETPYGRGANKPYQYDDVQSAAPSYGAAAGYGYGHDNGRSPATPHQTMSTINASSAPRGGAPPSQQQYHQQQPTHGQNRSPILDKIEQNRSREEQLRLELARIAEENARLERDAEAEREALRRRESQHQEEALRQREAEIQRQREMLRQMEEEYQRDQQRLRR
jgi:hypothetical protein